jgi:outer membrane protein assembly factor BamB
MVRVSRIAPALALVAAACGDNAAPAPDPHCADWHQWGNNAQHTGASCATGQPLDRVLADVPIDLLAADERADSRDELVVHYQAPLVDADRVFMVRKGGTYTPCVPQMDPSKTCSDPADQHRFESQTWSEVGYAWQGDALVEQWTYDSAWKPPLGEEVVFQPVIAGDRVAIPEAEGAVAYVDEASGKLARLVRPFGHDANVYIVGALADFHGVVFYNAIELDPTGTSYPHSWLVEIDGDGRARMASYDDLVPDAPSSCLATYFDADPQPPGPWPPLDANGAVVPPPALPCGPQNAGFNAAPAVAPDGTVYVVSKASSNFRYSYLISVNPGVFDVNWARSLRGQLHDGCGVYIPYAADAPPGPEETCADGAPPGIDPETGQPPAGIVTSQSTSSPVVLPDGGVLYGTWSFYNEDRGHLFELSRDGAIRATYDFGWDLTPAVATIDGTTRIAMKDNHYGTYDASGAQTNGPYYLTTLDGSLEHVWSFQSANTQSCARHPDGSVTCTQDHPHGFEWCINAPAIDAAGTMYANSEDGNLYAITADGQLRGNLLLDTALGAAYTPVVLDREGRVYALNAGRMYVVGAR